MKTYHGSCHCGAVRFAAEIDLAAGTSRCNCTFCAKARGWEAIIKPSAFRLEAGADALADYTFGSKANHHLFCRHCGIRPFGRGHIEEIGGDFVAVNLGALDDATAADLAAAPVRHMNGRDEDWWNAPAETRHL